jgi:uncharacterized membrane protein
MRRNAWGYLAAVLILVCISVPSLSHAQDAMDAKPASGIWLYSSFPEISAHLGDNINFDLTMQNVGLPPERLELSLESAPTGWTGEFDSHGKPVYAATVAPDASANVALALTPPQDVAPGTYKFDVAAKGSNGNYRLPISVVLEAAAPAKLALEAKLPALRGTPKSQFDFHVTITNDTGADTTVNLIPQSPEGFQITFTESYGSQELTSLPIKAGEKKDVSVKVTPPEGIAAGQYTVAMDVASDKASAEIPLLLDITGQPRLTLTGPDGRLSGDVNAGVEKTFDFTLRNGGTASATKVGFTSQAPEGWKITFDPKEIPEVAAGAEVPVTVSMSASPKAIAGDYVVSMRANATGASDSQSFRVTVSTSTMWGAAGIGVIAAALAVFAVAVGRYGRR